MLYLYLQLLELMVDLYVFYKPTLILIVQDRGGPLYMVNQGQELIEWVIYRLTKEVYIYVVNI